ncbi:MAG: hypothetical protein ABI561_27225 [Bradyrhizobium sp.]
MSRLPVFPVFAVGLEGKFGTGVQCLQGRHRAINYIGAIPIFPMTSDHFEISGTINFLRTKVRGFSALLGEQRRFVFDAAGSGHSIEVRRS